MAHSQARDRYFGSSVNTAYTIIEILKGEKYLLITITLVWLQNKNVNSLHITETIINF